MYLTVWLAAFAASFFGTCAGALVMKWLEQVAERRSRGTCEICGKAAVGECTSFRIGVDAETKDRRTIKLCMEHFLESQAMHAREMMRDDDDDSEG